jgi:phosphatidylglycerol---prolipoprotein diacylglyceryl transferase
MDHRTRMIRRLAAVGASGALVVLAAGHALASRGTSSPETSRPDLAPAAVAADVDRDDAAELNDDLSKDDAAEVEAPDAPEPPEAADPDPDTDEQADNDDQGENEDVDDADEAAEAPEADDADEADEADGDEAEHHDAAAGSGQHQHDGGDERGDEGDGDD